MKNLYPEFIFKLLGSALILPFILSCIHSQHNSENEAEITNEMAIKIAKNNIPDLFSDYALIVLNDMGLKVYKNFTTTNPCRQKPEIFAEYEKALEDAQRHKEWEEYRQVIKNLDNKLKNKTYWSVYFSPTNYPGQYIEDGGFCLFVDAQTGKVLGHN